MTEVEWDACADPVRMLDYLFPPTDAHVGLAKQFRPSERKMRLFCLAWRGAAGFGDHDRQWEDELPTTVLELHGTAVNWAPSLARLKTVPPADQSALLRCVLGNPFRPLRLCDATNEEAVPWRECHRCRAVRDDWLARNDCRVRKIAQTIHDEGDFDSAPILADALEEAGCQSEVERTIDVTAIVYPLPPDGWVVAAAAPEFVPHSPRRLHVCRRRDDAFAWAVRNLNASLVAGGTRPGKKAPGGSGSGKMVVKETNPILEHLRGPVCPHCEQGYVPLTDNVWPESPRGALCPRCGGAGRTKVVHARCCHVIDAITGRQ